MQHRGGCSIRSVGELSVAVLTGISQNAGDCVKLKSFCGGLRVLDSKWTDRRLVKDLDYIPVQVAQVIRNRTVAMAPQWKGNLEVVFAGPLVTRFQLIERSDDEPKMVKRLGRKIAGGATMEGQVVTTGTHVCVIIIRLPDDGHPEYPPIEIGCPRYVFYVQRQVSESAMLDHSTCYLS